MQTKNSEKDNKMSQESKGNIELFLQSNLDQVSESQLDTIFGGQQAIGCKICQIKPPPNNN